jgi:hypothetical protein
METNATHRKISHILFVDVDGLRQVAAAEPTVAFNDAGIAAIRISGDGKQFKIEEATTTAAHQAAPAAANGAPHAGLTFEHLYEILKGFAPKISDAYVALGLPPPKSREAVDHAAILALLRAGMAKALAKDEPAAAHTQETQAAKPTNAATNAAEAPKAAGEAQSAAEAKDAETPAAPAKSTQTIATTATPIATSGTVAAPEEPPTATEQKPAKSGSELASVTPINSRSTESKPPQIQQRSSNELLRGISDTDIESGTTEALKALFFVVHGQGKTAIPDFEGWAKANGVWPNDKKWTPEVRRRASAKMLEIINTDTKISAGLHESVRAAESQSSEVA